MSLFRDLDLDLDPDELFSLPFDDTFGPPFEHNSFSPLDMAFYEGQTSHPAGSYNHTNNNPHNPGLVGPTDQISLPGPSNSSPFAHSDFSMARAHQDDMGHFNSPLQSIETPGVGLQPYQEASEGSVRDAHYSSQPSRPGAHYGEATVRDTGDHADDERHSFISQADAHADDSDNSPVRRRKGASTAVDDVQTPLLIQSEQQFLDELGKRVKEDRLRKQRNLLEDGEEIDFPSTEAEQLVHIEQLVSAIKNTEDILDKPCKNGRPAQAAQRFDRGYYPQQQIELAAWMILFGLRDAQLGVVLVELHHGYKHEEYSSFDARFKAVVGTLTRSKATCKQLLDPYYVDRLCDAPDSELQMKLSNKKVNAQRDTQNQIGRKVLAGELAPDTIASLKVEETPSTPHTRRTLRNRAAPEGKIAVLTPKRTFTSRHNSATKPNTRGSTTRRGSGMVKKESFSEEEEDDDGDDDEDFDDEEEEEDNYYATPRSRNKRKVGQVKYAENVESSDDGSEYNPNLETPTKKVRTSARRRGATGSSSITGLSHMGSLPNAPSPTGSLSHHGLPMPKEHFNYSEYPPGYSTPNNNSKYKLLPPPITQYQYNSPSSAGSFAQTLAATSNAGNKAMDVNKKETYEAYRDVVCDLLNINREQGKAYSLSDLRRYARGYNQSVASISYTDPATPGWGFKGYKAFRDGSTIDHFALLTPQMMSIGKVRGDIDQVGEFVPFAPYDQGFQTHDVNADRAIGAAPNEFGVPAHLYPSSGMSAPAPAPAGTGWNNIVDYGASGALFSSILPPRK